MKREITFPSLKDKHWVYLISFFVIMSLLGLSVVPLLAGFRITLEDLNNIHFPWFISCFCVAFLAICLDAWRLKVLLASHSERLGIRESIKIVLIYAFFSAMTPTSFGGEFSMAYLLTRQKVPSGTAVSSTLTRSLLPLIILLPVFPIATILLPGVLPRRLSHYLRVLALFSVIIIAGLIFLRLERRRFGDLLNKKLKGLPEKGIKRFAWRIIGKVWFFYGEVEIAFRDMVTYGWFNNVLIILLTIAHLFALYSLGPLTAQVFGLHVPYFKGILTLCMVHLIVYITPTPSGSGVAEAFFSVAFGHFIETSGFMVVAFWRFFSEYGRVITGGLFTVLELKKIGREREETSGTEE